jgi:predicted TPR repeat methyltransferase
MLSTDAESRAQSPATNLMNDTGTPERPAASELSLDDALALAVRLQRAGNVDDAETLYRRILAVAPDQPDALNFLGIISMHFGRVDEAIDFIGRSIAADPSQGERYSNLGNVLLAAERIDEAVDAYERAILLSPSHAAAYNNLGIIYRAQRRYDQAERAYARAIELDPAHVEAYTNFGNLFAARGDIPAAIKHHAKALTLRPHDPDSKTHIAFAYAMIGDIEGAARIYREWLEQEPNHPGVRHLLAACSGVDVPPRAPDDYIESTFDSFSTSFDAKLASLEYRAPQLVADAVAIAAGEPAKRLAVLDAGCGTGLCGPLLAPYASRIDGVDLSGGMLDRARARGVYDALVKAELTQHLQSRTEEYDLVVSADTLVYFGVLADVVLAAARALRPGGLLVFTVEKAAEPDAPDGHRINPHGRYSHTRSYVERVLADAAFAQTTIKDDELRMENGVPVPGLVVTARKASGNTAESNHGR